VNERLIPPPTENDWLKTEPSRSPHRPGPLVRFLDFLLSRSALAGRVTELEYDMTEQTTRTDELNEGLAALGSGLDELATRISELDDDPNNITPEQVAAVKALGERVNGLAVAAPEIPTPTEPTLPESPEVGPEPTTPQV
jgi:uncharacterized coiled-coil protein SlyX